MIYEIAHYTFTVAMSVIVLVVLFLFVGGVICFFQSRDTRRRFNARYGKK